MGKSVVEASLKDTFGEFYATRLSVSTGDVPRAFSSWNDRGLHPIVTEVYPWTGWERFIDSPPMGNSVDYCRVYSFTKQEAPNSPVRSKVTAYI